ncbi:ATPase [Synechococcus sp. PCC 7502]|uniref:ATP-binding protein n=1 Tax=Synechococcus sp. PCC 7502 TaxID=1173263 RepID=UPI00029FF34F|nr:ATP-binding protein [Synechococcus sp. PCC 7502]AFY75177.1 ATPase [Synechococcus sp. PCC 7502]
MSEIDDLFNQSDRIFKEWNLKQIPFTESASSLESNIDAVFTGRTEELKLVIPLLRGKERKRILVYGWTGIGKSAFILEILNFLKRTDQKAIVGYITLQPDMELGEAAFIALAREMPEDEWAQRQLNELTGLGNLIRSRKSEIGGNLGIQAKTSEETLNVQPSKYPALAFEELLNRALKKYDRVIIGIDDLDKQDPARVRQLLENAQGMLKGNAWFFLSGHPSGLTRDLVNRERGLFDLSIELKPFDDDTTYKMLKKYLASARIKEVDENNEAEALHPFTPETARSLCEKSSGIPRWFNRNASYILLRAANLGAKKITSNVLQSGFEYARQQLGGKDQLTAEEYYLLNLILAKGILSDETITLEELKKIGASEFNEILPILNGLIQKDIARLLPDERFYSVTTNPILSED